MAKEGKCLESEMMQKRDVWKFTKKKRDRLKGVYIKPGRRFMSNLEER